MMKNKSEKLFEKSKKLIPGGVNSPVRAYKSVGRTPLFIDHAKGSKIYDVDGNEYIDNPEDMQYMYLDYLEN